MNTHVIILISKCNSNANQNAKRNCELRPVGNVKRQNVIACIGISVILPRQSSPIQKLHTSVTRLEAQKTEKTINQVTLLGRVGADPQKRGSMEHPVINFSLATHFSYKYESGDILQRTDWHRISVFRPGLRDTVYKYLKKGQRVYVIGKLSYGEIKLDDGQVRTASTVIADDIIFFQTQQQQQDN